MKADRLSMVTGDVREPFPKEVMDAKVDTITMKHFLSAFSDSDARLIVKHCGMALVSRGKILLLQVSAELPSAFQQDGGSLLSRHACVIICCGGHAGSI